MEYIYIYPKKMQFAAYGQFVLVFLKDQIRIHIFQGYILPAKMFRLYNPKDCAGL